MTARPPRASTRSDGKRPKTRGTTHGDREKRRAPSIPTDRFERVDDDQVVEVTELPGAPAEGPTRTPLPVLRVAVLESGPHVLTAQAAVAAAGHTVASALGREGDQLRPALGEVDAVIVGLPGGELLIEAALALGAPRPIVIAACSSSAVDAARRAASAGADLATVRPHHAERLAPILLAAARLIEQRFVTEHEPGALQSFARFEQVAARELERARRYDYPLTLAMFSVELAPPPPPGVDGILRARAGNALVHAIRDIDVATELDPGRFLVLLPHTDRGVGAEVARRLISAVASVDPVIAGGRPFSPRLIGALVSARPGEPQALVQLLRDATQLLEQTRVTGASLAVET